MGAAGGGGVGVGGGADAQFISWQTVPTGCFPPSWQTVGDLASSVVTGLHQGEKNERNASVAGEVKVTKFLRYVTSYFLK